MHENPVAQTGEMYAQKRTAVSVTGFPSVKSSATPFVIQKVKPFTFPGGPLSNITLALESLCIASTANNIATPMIAFVMPVILNIRIIQLRCRTTPRPARPRARSASVAGSEIGRPTVQKNVFSECTVS